MFQLIHPIRNAEDLGFADFMDCIGEDANMDISLDFIQIVREPEDLISFAFPPHILHCADSCLKQSILAPCNDQVKYYNNSIIQHVPGHERIYCAVDSLKEACYRR